jgi:inhibitor of KinA sporulation pathway (predicted exonuclease)
MAQMSATELASHRLAIVDLEATCWRGTPAAESEVIEIGAVFVEATGEVVDEFQTFVRPTLAPQLSPFCRSLTHIAQADVDPAPTFGPALEAFADWADGHGEFVLGSWGEYDKNQLRRECRRNDLTYPFGAHVNLKRLFAAHEGRRPCGMSKALRDLGLPLEGTHHRGIDDARNIARIWQTIRGHESC